MLGNGRIESLEFFGPKAQASGGYHPGDAGMYAISRLTGEVCEGPREILRPRHHPPGHGTAGHQGPCCYRVEQEGPVITYTVQGRLIGTSSEIPADTVQVYRVAWKGGRIVSLEFLGSPRRSPDWDAERFFRLRFRHGCLSGSCIQNAAGDWTVLFDHFFRGDIDSRPEAGHTRNCCGPS